ncbi:MAG: hypothetical protein GXO10_00740 [Crenarchaeota archaeon]|nr:hypothetical protein [Thermoproteota archaeon]
MENYEIMKIIRELDVYGCVSGATICVVATLNTILQNMSSKIAKKILDWLKECQDDLKICKEIANIEDKKDLIPKIEEVGQRVERIRKKVEEYVEGKIKDEELKREIDNVVKELLDFKDKISKRQDELRRFVPSLV